MCLSFQPYQNTDNYFYEIANDLEERSIDLTDQKEYLESWGVSFCARIPYLADAIVDIVAAPLYLLGCLFGSVPAVITWGEDTAILSTCGSKLLEKVNHLFLSLLGAAISPWLAHEFRDANIALCGLIVFGAVASEVSKRTVFAINLN